MVQGTGTKVLYVYWNANVFIVECVLLWIWFVSSSFSRLSESQFGQVDETVGYEGPADHEEDSFGLELLKGPPVSW